MKLCMNFGLGLTAMGLIATASQAAIIVNEFDYDQVGVDNAEFIELFNPDATAQPLAGFSLVLFNGTNTTNSAYQTLALVGSIPAGGYFTIGNITGAGQDIPGTADYIQNGNPDSFGIYTGAAPTTATATNLVAGTGIVYEGTNTGIPAAFTPVGATAADGDSNLLTASFSRIPDGTGAFVLTGTLTPGAANIASPIPEPTTLAALGLGGLLLRRRRA